MERTIENDRLKLTVSDEAAQMHSLFDKEKNREVLYQGDQGWSGRNPVLFPMVGSTWKKGEYEIDGKTYTMKNHGLVRYSTLKFLDDADGIVLQLVSDEETRKQYPFDFDFRVKYSLDQDVLHVDYEITNTGDCEMPFSFGLHPAFRTAQNPDEKFEDFALRFEPAMDGDQIIFFADKSPVQRVKRPLEEWKLDRKELAERDTLVFENFSTKAVTLKYQDEDRLTMSFDGYPYLAIWSHSVPSDFVCIEPWYGHTDFEKVEVPFEDREGTQHLQPGDTFKASWSLTVH